MDNEREERAVWLKHHGHNCCQSVIKALTEDDAAISDVEREVLHRAGAGFRTGMGGMEATCGALCGAVMVAGLKLPDTVVAGKAAKQMHERFVEISGASICKILKSRRPDGRFVCDCDDCVRHGVRVFGEIM
jgi:C_GCAxxG_C_C family probable redox protein